MNEATRRDIPAAFALTKLKVSAGYKGEYMDDFSQNHFIANMVLDRDLVDVSRGVSVGYVEACTRVGVWTPDAVECAAASWKKNV